MNPQDITERPSSPPKADDKSLERSEEGDAAGVSNAPDHNFDFDRLKLGLPSALMPESSAQLDLLSFNFENIDTQRAIDSYSVKSSVKNSSSGILEVLQDLEAEEEREKERKQHQLKASTTQSHQDLSSFKPKEESKRFALRSLLKRTHSAPKKIQVTKTPRPEEVDLDQREKSPPHQAQCCHPIVEKLKTMADKQLHKKTPKKETTKSKTIKKIPLKDDKKIVLAEQTRIIRLKDSPKAERKNVAAYLEKRDSDDIVEIFQLDESPSETRKRREECRKLDEQDTFDEEERERKMKQDKQQQKEKEQTEEGFVVPQSLTGLDTEPTVEELLEEEFKNDPPKKAPRKHKEHVYEDIEAPGAISTLNSEKLGKPANIFACAVLHSVLNKEQFKEDLKRQTEIEDAVGQTALTIELADNAAPIEINVKQGSVDDAKPVPEEVIDLKPVERGIVEEPTTTDATADVSQEIQSSVEITVENTDGDSEERTIDETDESGNQLTSDARKDVLIKDEKKVKFSQSTEERYQEKMAAEKGPDKEDVELPEHIQVSKRWSNMWSV